MVFLKRYFATYNISSASAGKSKIRLINALFVKKKRSQYDFEKTVAVRRPLFMKTAISPKNSPSYILRIQFPAMVTSTWPFAIM